MPLPVCIYCDRTACCTEPDIGPVCLTHLDRPPALRDQEDSDN